MKLFQRLAEWLNGSAKAMSPEALAFMTGTDATDNEQGAKLVHPYQQSAWVYTAVTALADAVSSIPFRISHCGDQARRVKSLMNSADPRHREMCRRSLGDNVLESGPAVELFARPHPTMDRALFWSMLVSWDALRGEVFILPLDNENQPVDMDLRNATVERLITCDPSLFWHMVSGYELTGWRYSGSPLLTPIPGQVLLPTELIHSRTANPYQFWRGMSPLTVAMLPAMADYAAEMFMKGLLMNNADTGIIATTEQNLTPEQREQFMVALRERKRKAGTPDRPLFLSSGVKIERPTISNVDMQFLETRRLLRQEIGAIFKVPEALMGFNADKSSALSGGGNAIEQERLQFIQHTIAPKCRKYEAALAPVVDSFGPGLVGWFDIDSHPAMQASRMSRVDAATKVFALGVPFNDINEVYDLGFPDYPWGNKGYLPFSLQPADAVTEMPGENETDETEETDKKPEEPGEAETPAEKGLRFLRGLNGSAEVKTPNTKLLWESHVRARAATVKLFQRKMQKVLNDFRGKALAKLSTMDTKAGGGLGDAALPEEKAWEKRGLVDLIFDANEFGKSLALVFEAPMRQAMQDAGDAARKEVGAKDPWRMPPEKAGVFIKGRKQAIQGVGGTVRDQLNTSLEEGYENGETTAELAGRVKTVFNGLTDKEAVRVARTETNMTMNYARQESLKSAGIMYKSWLSSHGPKVRIGHAMAEEAYINDPIPMDEPFIVDLDGDAEQMMYPGDDSLGASVGNIINCQCIQLAAEPAETAGADGKWWKVYGLGMVWFGSKTTKAIAHGTAHCCN